MEAKFFIDRQFGQAIWIDVEDGIVKKVYNDSLLEKKMNEVYGGKLISFLKEDFESRMKGTFHCVHSTEMFGAKRKLTNINMRIEQANTYLNEKHKNDKAEFTPEEKATLEILQKEKTDAEFEIAVVKRILKDVHKFDF